MIKILKIIRIFHDHVVKKDRYLQYLCKITCNRPPDRTCRRPPGRPRNKWLDQLRNDSTRSTGEFWRRAVDRGHGGATTRRPSPATRQCLWWIFVLFPLSLVFSSKPKDWWHNRVTRCVQFTTDITVHKLCASSRFVSFVLIFYIHRVAQKSANL